MTGSTLLIILVAVTARTTSTAALLVASAVTAQLLIVVAAVAYHLHQRAGEREAAMASAELGFRAELAEAALDRERDRLHELRATVVGITLSRRMLQERRNELPAPTRSRLEQLQQAELERLERLLDDDARQGSEAVDLGSVVDRLVDAMRIRGHHVLWSGTSHRVWAPSDDVTQIVHVLLTNAARHGGGQDVAVDVREAEDGIELRVRDLGPGVPPELLPSIFERGVCRPGSPGQGIGLDIARRLSRELGGDLRYEAPGRCGAEFVLTMPALRGAASCHARSA